MLSTAALLRLVAVLPATTLALATRAPAKEFDVDDITLREVGARNTLDWRIWLEKDGDPISFWHDIPLYPYPNDTSIIHYYTEIPRWTDGKIETNRDEPLNPIFHDDKDDLPRFVYSVWPHKTYPFNYGSIPQTWENSNIEDDYTGFPGDNDPVDIFDISSLPPSYVGEIKKVKVLGSLAMIDDEETDYKVISIDVNDPLAPLLNSVEDVDKYIPGLSQEFYDWFIYYKVIKGSGTNTILGDGYMDAAFTQEVLTKSHQHWTNLVNGKEDPGDISIKQTSNPKLCNSFVSSKKATKKFDIPEESDIEPAAEKPAKYDMWYYLDDNFEPIALPGQ